MKSHKRKKAKSVVFILPIYKVIGNILLCKQEPFSPLSDGLFSWMAWGLENVNSNCQRYIWDHSRQNWEVVLPHLYLPEACSVSCSSLRNPPCSEGGNVIMVKVAMMDGTLLALPGFCILAGIRALSWRSEKTSLLGPAKAEGQIKQMTFPNTIILSIFLDFVYWFHFSSF